MKKQILSGLIIFASIGIAVAQDDVVKELKEAKDLREVALKAAQVDTAQKRWTFGGNVALNFGQVALVNWAGGGQNSISALLNANGFANYKKGRWAWDNSLVASWGIIAQGKIRDIKTNKFPVRKNQDLLQVTSKAGYAIDKHNKWFVAGLADFRSQFSNGYTYPGDSVKDRVSSFAAPAYVTLTAGINYKPVDWFSIYLSPVAGKLTFVTKDVPGAVSRNDIDETQYGLTLGKAMRAEFGAYLRADLQKDIFKNVNLKTSIELFQNYLEKKKLDVIVDQEIKDVITAGGTPTADQYKKQYYDNRTNTDINWNTMITFKINKFLQASLETQLIYDHDISIPKTRGDGTAYKGRGTQFREAFNLGIGYKF